MTETYGPKEEALKSDCVDSFINVLLWKRYEHELESDELYDLATAHLSGYKTTGKLFYNESFLFMCELELENTLQYLIGLERVTQFEDLTLGLTSKLLLNIEDLLDNDHKNGYKLSSL
jgi:hypothetical protein